MSTQVQDTPANRIADSILSFFQFKKSTNDLYFNVEDLHHFLNATGSSVAPASPCRVLRKLRQAGWLDYVVVNRAKSQYFIL
jgi:hypothetical protein